MYYILVSYIIKNCNNLPAKISKRLHFFHRFKLCAVLSTPRGCRTTCCAPSGHQKFTFIFLLKNHKCSSRSTHGVITNLAQYNDQVESRFQVKLRRESHSVRRIYHSFDSWCLNCYPVFASFRYPY